MKLRNPFSDKTRVLYIDHQYCMSCGSNNIPELHHIAGRVSNSPLNAIVLCHNCHARCGHSEEEEKKYFGINLIYLMQIGYEFTDQDIQFAQYYKRLYDTIYDTKHKIVGEHTA